MIIGYARTSTDHQEHGLRAQIAELERLGCEKIFSEQVSSMSIRPELVRALEFMRDGDVFMVTALDRLARSVADLMEICKTAERKQVTIRVLNLGMDTNTPTGKLMLTMLAGVAQFEREIMLERQREGITKAKAAGRYKGRKPIEAKRRQQVIALAGEGLSKPRIARETKLGVATVYRILAESREPVTETTTL
jgi:DNA invertase Pin-like site-specific DNA recombinase